jgi:hypothetical protein
MPHAEQRALPNTGGRDASEGVMYREQQEEH